MQARGTHLEKVDGKVAAHDAVGHGGGDLGVQAAAGGQDALQAAVKVAPEAGHAAPLLPGQLQPLSNLRSKVHH